VALATRPPRTEMYEREKVSLRAHRAPRCHRSPGPPGASAPGVESRDRRVARVGARPRPRAGQGRSQPGRLGVRAAIPSDSTSVEELEPRVGRPARVEREACLRGPASGSRATCQARSNGGARGNDKRAQGRGDAVRLLTSGILRRVRAASRERRAECRPPPGGLAKRAGNAANLMAGSGMQQARSTQVEQAVRTVRNREGGT
jgi:hypothetical protein